MTYRPSPLEEPETAFVLEADDSGFLTFFGSRFLMLLFAGAGASSPESSKAAKKFWDCQDKKES